MEGDYDSMFLLEMNILCSLRLPPWVLKDAECIAVEYCSSIVLWALAVGWGVSFQIKGLLWKTQPWQGLYSSYWAHGRVWVVFNSNSPGMYLQELRVVSRALWSPRWGIACGKGMYGLGPWRAPLEGSTMIFWTKTIGKVNSLHYEGIFCYKNNFKWLLPK